MEIAISIVHLYPPSSILNSTLDIRFDPLLGYSPRAWSLPFSLSRRELHHFVVGNGVMIRLAPRIGLSTSPAAGRFTPTPNRSAAVSRFTSVCAANARRSAIVLLFHSGFHIDPAYWSGARQQMPMGLTLIGVDDRDAYPRADR